MVAVQSASKVGPKAECQSQNGGLQTALPARWGVFSHTETAIRLAEQSSNTKKNTRSPNATYMSRWNILEASQQ